MRHRGVAPRAASRWLRPVFVRSDRLTALYPCVIPFLINFFLSQLYVLTLYFCYPFFSLFPFARPVFYVLVGSDNAWKFVDVASAWVASWIFGARGHRRAMMFLTLTAPPCKYDHEPSWASVNFHSTRQNDDESSRHLGIARKIIDKQENLIGHAERESIFKRSSCRCCAAASFLHTASADISTTPA